MTRTQRRTHLVLWLLLGPMLVAVLVVAIGTRSGSIAVRAGEVAR